MSAQADGPHPTDDVGERTHLALLDRAGRIVGVNDAWANFAMAEGGDLKSCGVGASYLAVCDAAGDEGSRAVGDHIRAAITGKVIEPLAVLAPCPTPHADLWFTILVSSRLTEDMECLGASVAAVPVIEPTRPPVLQIPSPARSILDGVAVAVDAAVACLYVEEARESSARVVSTSITSRPYLSNLWPALADELARGDDTARLVDFPLGDVDGVGSAMMAVVRPNNRCRMTLLVAREPTRSRFVVGDLEALGRMARYVGRQWEVLEQRRIAATVLDVRAREEIAKEMQATTLRSLINALASLESIVGTAQSNFAERQIMLGIHELEAALAGIRNSLLVGLPLADARRDLSPW